LRPERLREVSGSPFRDCHVVTPILVGHFDALQLVQRLVATLVRSKSVST
jgi:hypothetical protein